MGERGLRLSSGQRQQLALARAILRDAPLLLLDEPTAPAATARRLDAAITTLLPGRTVIQVTHGPGWAHDTGRMLALEAGRLSHPDVPACGKAGHAVLAVTA